MSRYLSVHRYISLCVLKGIFSHSRLNAKQNAVARLKIQQVLYEAEFGGPGDLPYVTPASDCSFDHLDSTVE